MDAYPIMFWVPTSGGEPNLGRLALVFCMVGVLAVVPALTWLVMLLFGADELFTKAATDTQIWIFLGSWQVGNLLWWIPTYRVDRWDAERRTGRRR